MIELPVGTWGDRGTWQGNLAATNFGQTHRFLSICCPICGSDSALSDYIISPDGMVSPPFLCPYGCGCRTTVKLQGYVEFLRKAIDPEPDISRESESNHS